MIEFKTCTNEHIALIEPQDSQRYEYEYYRNNTDQFVAHSLGVSCWHDGVCVGAGGIQPIWEGRAVAWTLFGKHSGKIMVPIVRRIGRFLAMCPVNRVEMTVRESFGEGCRLALLLGFRFEARLLGFFPDGSTASLYARFRNF